MSTAFRQNLFNAFSTRLTTLGHTLSAAEIWMLVDDAEAQAQSDASANADATTDVTGGDVDPSDVQGT